MNFLDELVQFEICSNNFVALADINLTILVIELDAFDATCMLPNQRSMQ